jgi:N-acetylmuramoyl-L-alanine amidase
MSELIVNGKAISLPKESPNSRNDRDGQPPKYIVLHSTGGGFAGAVSWLMNALSPTKASAHFVVSRKGEIRQLVSIHRVAFHAGKAYYMGHSDMNGCSIGIEMEHYDGKQDWPTVQLQVVTDLCAVLGLKFKLNVGDIVSHAGIAMPRGRKIDPYMFPWEDFRTRYMGAVSKLRLAEAHSKGV